MKQFKEIDILEDVLKPEYWEKFGERKHKSHHMYRNSPYESDDSCGNCNGANCHCCKDVIEPETYKFCMYSDKIYELLIEKGLDKETESYYAYDDSFNMYHNGYHLNWPCIDSVRVRFPDFYNQLITL